MKRRINFSAWGRGVWKAPAFALGKEGEEAAAVARAIARKSGVELVTLRSDGTSRANGVVDSRHYVASFGTPCRGGGWSPTAEVWFAIPVTA